MSISSSQLSDFQNKVLTYYKEHKRLLPWREHIDPYWVVLTEIMLQQTQVSRVLVKFPQFIKAFPTFNTLADASLSDVLSEWQGMGYNRRGKYLHEIARRIVNDFHGVVPFDPCVLEMFPGIGHATARSIVVYIYNSPEVFIETNVRRVYIHHFFQDRSGIHDREIVPLLKQTILYENPREWYYALMDYGTFLSKQVPNPNRKSKHYTKQSKFEGSSRQVRSYALKVVLDQKKATIEDIIARTGFQKDRVSVALKELEKDGMIRKMNSYYMVT